MKKSEAFVLPVVLLVAVLAIWHFGVIWTGSKVFPTPLAVVSGMQVLFANGLLFNYTRDSLFRVAAGYGLGVALGIPIGMVLGWYPTAAQVANPIIQMMRPISPLAWIPVSIVWFGVGEAAPIFLIFLASFFPVVVATINGVINVPSMFRNGGMNFGLSPVGLLYRVIFPAALPQIIVGLRIALGIAWLVVVAAEMIAVDSGLGYLIIDSRNAGKRYDLVVAGMLLIGAIGLSLDIAIRRIEKFKSVRWGFANE